MEVDRACLGAEGARACVTSRVRGACIVGTSRALLVMLGLGLTVDRLGQGQNLVVLWSTL
jgi:hypothetical protein